MTIVEDAFSSVDIAPVENGLKPNMEETSAPRTSPFSAEFEEIILQTLKEWHIPGMSIAVIDGKGTWTQVTASPNSGCHDRADNQVGLWLCHTTGHSG